MFDFSNDIILEDTVVLLRPLVFNDFQQLKPIAFEDKNLLQYSPKPIYNKIFLKEYIENALENRIQKQRYPFIIIDKHSKSMVGSTSLCAISDFDKRAEIGYTWIGKKYQHTQINKRCKYLLLHYCFKKLDYRRVEFKTDERNSASRRALLSIGATEEGILRSHTLMHDGYRRNTVYYSILKEEFETSRLSIWYENNN
jgi:RimJ/RimL family protein N-acetyltransferase